MLSHNMKESNQPTKIRSKSYRTQTKLIISAIKLKKKNETSKYSTTKIAKKKLFSIKNRNEPALTPEEPALFKPFFLTMKLAPMKKLDDRANTKPFTLSDDIPL